MLQYLENLRKKPEAERRKAVFLISLYMTLAIAIVWAIVTSIRFAHTDFSFGGSEVDKKMPSVSETLSNIFDRASQIMSPSSVPAQESTSTGEGQ